MRPASSSRVDQDARALRERFELVVLSDDDKAIADAARALFWFCSQNAEYALCRMWPPADSAPTPQAKRIASKYLGRCTTCNAFIVPGEEVWFLVDQKGVTCLKCGGSL